jgi:hypothetical protein
MPIKWLTSVANFLCVGAYYVSGLKYFLRGWLYRQIAIFYKVARWRFSMYIVQYSTEREEWLSRKTEY